MKSAKYIPNPGPSRQFGYRAYSPDVMADLAVLCEPDSQELF
jgi:hypothetical protein